MGDVVLPTSVRGMTSPASKRTTVRRGADRAVYNMTTVREILKAGMVAHMGVQTPDGPLVLPMSYGLDETHIYLHGALANHLLGSGGGAEVCVTVTHLDGLVMARTPFNNSMNYRSVVVRGVATKIVDREAKLRALKIITDHIVPNWDSARPASEIEERSTLVVSVPLAEASAKIRAGDPEDESSDIDGPWWAGVIPIATVIGDPIPSANLAPGVSPTPPYPAFSFL